MELHPKEKPRSAKGRLVVERPAVLHAIGFRGQLNTFGAFSYGNSNVTIYNSDVGRYCSIAQDVMIAPVEHPVDWLSTNGFAFNDRGTMGHSSEFLDIVSERSSGRYNERTSIDHDVWIGCRAFIRRGVQIGTGAIIGANAAVTKNVDPFTIVAGVPARPIRKRFPDAMIKRIMNLRWWEFSLLRTALPDIEYSKPDAALDQIERAIESGAICKLLPQKICFVDGVLDHTQ